MQAYQILEEIVFTAFNQKGQEADLERVFSTIIDYRQGKW